MATSTTLDKARTLLEERLGEINEEKARLERALKDLNGGATRARRGPGRPRGSTTKRRRRRARGGTRAEQAVKIITDDPGVTASQVAERMKIKPNYVYRVMGELESDGRVKKQGKGYHPTAKAAQKSAS